MQSNVSEIFAKTKILCTLGPATDSIETLRKLILAGIDGVRLNFSHGSYEFFEKLFININEAGKAENVPLSVLVDLQGPKIRIGELTEPEIELETGSTIEITTENLKGTKQLISTSYNALMNDAAIGDPVLIDDGRIRLRVTEKK